MKIDALRKSLEEQVKQLQVQIQEAEAAALLGGKRVIAKLETRIRDLETALDEETRRHKETQNALRKKDRRIKWAENLNFIFMVLGKCKCKLMRSTRIS